MEIFLLSYTSDYTRTQNRRTLDRWINANATKWYEPRRIRKIHIINEPLGSSPRGSVVFLVETGESLFVKVFRITSRYSPSGARYPCHLPEFISLRACFALTISSYPKKVEALCGNSWILVLFAFRYFKATRITGLSQARNPPLGYP